VTITRQPFGKNGVIKLGFDAYLSDDALILLKIEGIGGGLKKYF
jgi:hypothetical protein